MAEELSMDEAYLRTIISLALGSVPKETLTRMTDKRWMDAEKARHEAAEIVLRAVLTHLTVARKPDTSKVHSVGLYRREGED